MKRFKRVYIEITNICNLSCSFCPKTKRIPRSLNTLEFEHIVKEVKPFTEHIYLHVMGEPLIHKNIAEFLKIAKDNELKVNITTNGTNISKTAKILLQNTPRKISFSLHSFEGNKSSKDLENYIKNITDFTDLALAKNIIIEFRLWNNNKNNNDYNLNKLNEQIVTLIEQNLNVAANLTELIKNEGGVKLKENCYMGYDNVFTWPDEQLGSVENAVYCLALKDQIAILSDGTVVPCCLDNNGTIKLGNIFDTPLINIVNGSLSQAILLGFRQRTAVCKLCKNCGYAKAKFNNI